MDNWLMLVIGVVVVVVIEVIAYRAYKRYRARKEARFTKESLGEVFGDMEATRAYLLRAKEFLKQCSKQAKEEGDEAVACLVDSLLAGERAQARGAGGAAAEAGREGRRVPEEGIRFPHLGRRA